MSAEQTFIQALINNALLQTHTAFCGKVISVSGGLAKVQPLHMTKAVDGKAQKRPVIPNVPILKPTEYITSIRCGHSCEGGSCNITWTTSKIKAGDIVYCVCAERDITETRKGKVALPVQGRHMISDAVIVGKFEV